MSPTANSRRCRGNGDAADGASPRTKSARRRRTARNIVRRCETWPSNSETVRRVSTPHMGNGAQILSFDEANNAQAVGPPELTTGISSMPRSRSVDSRVEIPGYRAMPCACPRNVRTRCPERRNRVARSSSSQRHFLGSVMGRSCNADCRPFRAAYPSLRTIVLSIRVSPPRRFADRAALACLCVGKGGQNRHTIIWSLVFGWPGGN
jgi:hypothetical protein